MLRHELHPNNSRQLTLNYHSQWKSWTYDAVHLLSLLDSALLVATQPTHQKHVPRVETRHGSFRQQSKGTANCRKGLAHRHPLS